MPYGSICCTYQQLKYSSPNRSKNNSKTRATQKSLPFGKWRFRGKGQESGPKAENDKTERAAGLDRIRTREEI